MQHMLFSCQQYFYTKLQKKKQKFCRKCMSSLSVQ